ncbi:MAG: sulfatase-like hydrolase/transferase [Deltaproteobacteria bacterium]|nr:sulfatase-like hydrolase/transferase [Deltaproteobacteria bacterium]
MKTQLNRFIKRATPMLFLGVILVGCALIPECSKKRPPNVVLVTIDTLRADHLGCYGYSRKTSPSIDRIAGEGVLFESAVAQAPWTLPSLASMMTSKHPLELGMMDMAARFSPSVRRLSTYFKEAGYETAAFVSGAYVTMDRGFEVGFDVYEKVAREDRAVGLNTRMFRWLAKPKKTPFFLWVHYFDVHSDYDAPAPFNKLFDDTPQSAEIGRTDFLKKVLAGATALDEAHTRALISLYDREIAYTDAAVGKLVEQLEERVGTDNTIFAIGSDHGEALMDHGKVLHTLTLYEELVHVPLIIRYPAGLPKGRRVMEVVQNLDILPTLLDLAGIRPISGLRGESLVPLARGRFNKERVAYSHTDTTSQLRHYSHIPLLNKSIFDVRFAMRRGYEKVIFSRNSQSMELYNLKKDPHEKNNIYKADKKRAGHLEKELFDWIRELRSVSPPPPVHNPLSPKETEQLRALGYLR